MFSTGRNKRKKKRPKRGAAKRFRLGKKTSASHVKKPSSGAREKVFRSSLVAAIGVRCVVRDLGVSPAMMEKRSWLPRESRLGTVFSFPGGGKGCLLVGRRGLCLVSGVKGKTGSWLEREDGGVQARSDTRGCVNEGTGTCRLSPVVWRRGKEHLNLR